MKLTGRANDRLQFQLTAREKDLLVQVLRLYPLIPSAYQRLSKAGAREEPNQRLLDEALAETRLQNKKELEALLIDAERFAKCQGGWRLALSATDVEWFLQVLNDIRVGSWIQLGSPNTPLSVLNAESAPQVWAMEMAGSLQMRFLELLEP